jgi:hypothetical protein
MELVSCLPYGAWNFEMAPRFLENVWTPDLVHPERAKELVLSPRKL